MNAAWEKTTTQHTNKIILYWNKKFTSQLYNFSFFTNGEMMEKLVYSRTNTFLKCRVITCIRTKTFTRRLLRREVKNIYTPKSCTQGGGKAGPAGTTTTCEAQEATTSNTRVVSGSHERRFISAGVFSSLNLFAIGKWISCQHKHSND
jgi:hypothetical protein